MKLVYVAGKYSAPTQQGVYENIQAAREVAVGCWKLGLSVICPHLNTAFMDGVVSYEEFMEGDFEQIKRCDGLVLTPFWRESKGAMREFEMARGAGIEVFEYLGDYFELVTWAKN